MILDTKEDTVIVYQSSTSKDSPPPMYTDSTYMIISKVAYLSGVPIQIFENPHEPPKMEWYEELQKDKNARIIRNLCCIRNALERSYQQIYRAMVYDLKNLHTLPDLVPQDSLQQLIQDGIDLVKANAKPLQYVIDINQHINNRINNCKNLFPIWIKWPYIKELFLMPNGTTENGAKADASKYVENRSNLPYQVYMNWNYLESGNILYNDKKFVILLYECHGDYFSDMRKVTDAGAQTKSSVYDFLVKSNKTVVVVDCENSDPFKLYATLNNLDKEVLLDKISKIVLFDDVHTTTAWQILEDFTDIPIEHILIERIKENKSLVDIRLAATTAREHYQNDVDSFILVSSDSDYWGLISALPEARFFVMVESSKFGVDMKNALIEAEIRYCYIDDFCTGNSNEIKVAAVLAQVNRALSEAFCVNINEILDDAYTNTRVNLSPAERKQLYDRYIKPMKIVIDQNGYASIQLGS